jgi:hypothetical protein
MAIYDRWYTTERADGSSKKVRSADYGCEKRWQARWRDDQGRQRKQAFERKTDAERFEATVKTQLASGTYVDPSAGDITLQAYAEAWRGRQTHDDASAERVAGILRRHVYSAPAAGPPQAPRRSATTRYAPWPASRASSKAGSPGYPCTPTACGWPPPRSARCSPRPRRTA